MTNFEVIKGKDIKKTTISFFKKIKNSQDGTMLFCAMLFFKFTLDLGYWIILTIDKTTYEADFNLLKYIVGIIWCVLLFFGINHKEKKASTFFLYLVYLTQIIPITTIYSLANENSTYYNILCIAFFICEMLVWHIRNDKEIIKRNETLSNLMMIGFFCVVVIVLVTVVVENGLPTLTALNIYDVYEIRSRNSFHIGKYMNYLLVWVVNVIIPLFITKMILEKKYLYAGLFSAIQYILYLYTGNKSWLFMLPLVIISVLWSKRKNFYREIFIVFCIGIGVLTIMACFSPIMRDFWEEMFSLFCRRVMLLSANNKFVYYDYFINNPHMGLGGIFPRWLIDIPNYYENIPYTYEISEIYFGKPQMNSNTGFLAEGFARFGHVGIILILVLFAILLREIDRFQERENYSITIGIFVYPIFALSDAYLLDSFIVGPWMILTFVLVFYTDTGKKGYNEFEKQIKSIYRKINSHVKKE